LLAVVEYCTTEELPVTAAGFVAGALFLGGFANKLRQKIISETTEEERRTHVYNVVFPAALKIIPPAIVITSEVNTCWLMSYFESSEESLLKTKLECEGIAAGTMPILLMLFTLCAWPIAIVRSNKARGITLESITKMELNVAEICQVVVLGIYGLYAVTAYVLREKKPANLTSLGTVAFVVFTNVLAVAMAAGAYYSSDSGLEEENEEAAEENRTSARQSSMEDRSSVGKRRSV
jgi:hypothetical protein